MTGCKTVPTGPEIHASEWIAVKWPINAAEPFLTAVSETSGRESSDGKNRNVKTVRRKMIWKKST